MGAKTSSRTLVVKNRPPAADLMTDVVVVGSDPAGLAAALACRQAGWEVTVIEPGLVVGGDAARGDGAMWLPGRPYVTISGTKDDYATARNYLDHSVTEYSSATSASRRHAFLTHTESAVNWLASNGISLTADPSADHYPDLPGGARSGRVMVPDRYDARELGMLGQFLPRTARAGSQVASASIVDRASNALGKRMVRGGTSLVAGLLAAVVREQTTIWWDAQILDLLVDEAGERVTGVIVQRAGRPVRVLAGRGVVLARGGYGHDPQARRDYLPVASRTAWTIATERGLGSELIDWASQLDLDLAGLNDAWWTPLMWSQDGKVWDARTLLAWPHGFMVNAAGMRICNEAAPGEQICTALFAQMRQRGEHESPAWLIFDRDHQRSVATANHVRGRIPKSHRDSGFVYSARTLPELAWQIKVDASGLEQTAARFDQFAASGVDDDFGKGRSPFDKTQGDRGHKPNPCLGAVTKPPFAAVRIVPGDRGTKGGLVTDAGARALRHGEPMGGLYAVGSAAASLSGSSDPAPGFGLAEGVIFGRIAARSITEDAGLLDV